jgi:hypothetical protein
VISFFMLRAIKRQADLTEKQSESSAQQLEVARLTAEAAQRNANSLMNSERAWLIVNVEFAPGSSGPFLGTHVERGVISKNTTVIVRLHIANQGRTPAWIDEVRTSSQLVESLDLLPVVPDFSSADVVVQAQLEPVGMRDEVKRDLTLTAQGSSESLDTQTIVCGEVAYRDVFGFNRQTRFGYVLVTKGKFERLTGFPAYNAHL